MSEEEYYDGVNVGIEIYQQRAFDAEATATRRKELLRRCESWLESYLDYLDNDIPSTGEPNNSVAALIDELAEELADE